VRRKQIVHARREHGQAVEEGEDVEIAFVQRPARPRVVRSFEKGIRSGKKAERVHAVATVTGKVIRSACPSMFPRRASPLPRGIGSWQLRRGGHAWTRVHTVQILQVGVACPAVTYLLVTAESLVRRHHEQRQDDGQRNCRASTPVTEPADRWQRSGAAETPRASWMFNHGRAT